MEKIKKAEWAIAVTLTGVIILLLIVRATSAGGLWRDECGALQLARMSSFSEICRYLQFESFPLLFPATLRLYAAIFGADDAAMRAFGLLVGFALLLVLWFNAWLLHRKLPLETLLLLGLNSAFLTWGTSVRGYGLGCVWVLLAFGLFEKVRRTPGAAWTGAAFVAAFAAVQYLFYDAVLLAAIGCPVLVICCLRRKFKQALAIVGIGVICAASLIPYFGFYSSGSQWNMLVKHDVGFSGRWDVFLSALGGESVFLLCLWAAFFMAVAIAAGLGLGRQRDKWAADARTSFWVALFIAVLSLLGYYVFLAMLGYVPRPWHLLALIAILAAALEMMVGNLPEMHWFRWLRLVLITVGTVVLPFIAWPQITPRQTNVDLVAKAVDLQAGRNDLVVVTPWYLGVPFHWYYHGTTPWLTIPEISDCRVHRYDLMKEKMMEPRPMDAIFESVEKTLKSGNRLWIAGYLRLPNPGQVPIILPPAPQSAYGWADPAYSETWSAQLGAFLQRNAVRAEVVPVDASDRFSGLENVPLLVVTGWRDQK